MIHWLFVQRTPSRRKVTGGSWQLSPMWDIPRALALCLSSITTSGEIISSWGLTRANSEMTSQVATGKRTDLRLSLISFSVSGYFVDDLVNNFPSPVKNYDAVNDAVKTIKETLTEAEDDSMVYIVIGFMINLRDFLAEAENRELFARKVNTVYIMGGQYDPESKTPEFHFGCGVVNGVDTFSNTIECQGSAKEAIENIPDSVPVRFVGQEIGEDVWTGDSLWSYCKSYDSLKNPCYRALSDWERQTSNKSTQSWDPITVTAAASSVFTVG